MNQPLGLNPIGVEWIHMKKNSDLESIDRGAREKDGAEVMSNHSRMDWPVQIICIHD